MKKAKNIHLTEEAIKALTIKAIEHGSNFKNYVESKLEALAQVSYGFAEKRKKKKKSLKKKKMIKNK